MDDVCSKKKEFKFRLRKHQLYLKNYISPHTPYNGILIYHGTGEKRLVQRYR